MPSAMRWLKVKNWTQSRTTTKPLRYLVTPQNKPLPRDRSGFFAFEEKEYGGEKTGIS